jgi:hypothetical protein
MEKSVGQIEVVASWSHVNTSAHLPASAPLRSFHCLDQAEYADMVDTAMDRIVPKKPDWFHFQCSTVTLRRIDFDLHAVIYNETQAQIDEYQQRHRGSKYTESIKIPIIDMGPTDLRILSSHSISCKAHGVSRKMLRERVKQRAKEVVKSLISTHDLAKMAGAIAAHKISIRARMRAGSTMPLMQ